MEAFSWLSLARMASWDVCCLKERELYKLVEMN